MVITIVFMLISAIFFNLLFYILNKSPLKVFKYVQNNLKKSKLLKKQYNKRILYILIILGISFLAEKLNLSSVLFGIILGFLFALIDICFEDNIIEDFTRKQKEK